MFAGPMAVVLPGGGDLKLATRVVAPLPLLSSTIESSPTILCQGRLSC